MAAAVRTEVIGYTTVQKSFGRSGAKRRTETTPVKSDKAPAVKQRAEGRPDENSRESQAIMAEKRINAQAT